MCVQACYIAVGWEPCKDSPGSAPADSSLCSLHAANVDPGRYPAAALPLQPPEGPLPAGTPSWLKYVHAAYRVRQGAAVQGVCPLLNSNWPVCLPCTQMS